MTPVLLGICLALSQTDGVPTVFVPVEEFTLVWTHSIEKVRWEEDYRVELDALGHAVLIAGSARIRGSGAGMEPPPDAVFEGGWYTYQPAQPSSEGLWMARSPYVPDYTWCMDGLCIPMSDLLPSDGATTHLYACTSTVDH